MKNIGMVVAVEIKSVFSKYCDKLENIIIPGYEVFLLSRNNINLYIIKSGVGQIKAAAATQLLIDEFDIELVVNFGVVGSLTTDLNIAKTCIVNRVVHYDIDTSAVDNIEIGRYIEYPDIYLNTSNKFVKFVSVLYPNLPIVTCASGDKFISDKNEKINLHRQFNADICDMESAAVVLISDINKIPNLIIKTVSDSISGGADEFIQSVNSSADICVNIIDNILQKIGSI